MKIQFSYLQLRVQIPEGDKKIKFITKITQLLMSVVQILI